MKFQGQYIYPPRPSRGGLYKEAAYFLSLEDKKEWVAQAKLNGQNTLAYCTKEKIVLWNRHANKSRVRLTPEQEVFFKDLQKKHGDLVINFEILDRKKNYRGYIYIYDILVLEGKWLLDSTYEQRHSKLLDILGNLKKSPFPFCSQTSVTSIWVTKNFKKNWAKIIEKHADLDIFEGLMLKNIAAPLKPGLSEENNMSWCLRCLK